MNAICDELLPPVPRASGSWAGVVLGLTPQPLCFRLLRRLPITFPRYRKFAWQEGYGAFSVSVSQMKSVISYIDAQKQHHRKRTFEEEFVEFLDKHGEEYDSRYVFR